MYFFIQGTKTSPAAIINNGYMKIAGNSCFVEEQNNFYGHINKQVDRYSQQPANRTYIDISLKHINAASKRNIIDLLKNLENLHKQGFQIVINWHFERDDEDLQELGEILDNMFEMEFKFSNN